MKALVGTLNQEKALVGAFSVIVKRTSKVRFQLYLTRMRVNGVKARRVCGYLWRYEPRLSRSLDCETSCQVSDFTVRTQNMKCDSTPVSRLSAVSLRSENLAFCAARRNLLNISTSHHVVLSERHLSNLQSLYF